MANPTSNFNWQMPTPTDLVTDLPADFEVFGQAVDSSMADLLGGTTGQILAKNSNTNMDFVWIANDQGDITAVTAGTGISGGGTTGAVTITNSIATAIDAKGDLVPGTGADAFARLAVGANETRLVADSGETTGLKYVADTTNYAIAAKGNLLAGTAADTVAALTVGANGTVLTADSAETTGMKWAAPVATVGPTFYAFLSTNQTVTSNVITKVQVNSEEYDLGSCYDNTTNYRFTPTTAGIYQFNFVINGSGSSGTTIFVYKNGAKAREGARTAGAGAPMGFSTQLEMNGTTDYVEFFAQVASGTTIYGGAPDTGYGAAYLRSN